ncbi:MAG TPA: GxxExxY protein [Gemmatimonadaceae bacterium]|jgi:GxxExxY protein|nr:GxxExxY protein [Gemmatimonadaceae bacterium]
MRQFDMRHPDETEDPLTKEIIGRAIKIQRVLGPRLLESAYECFLAHELGKAGLTVLRQAPIPVVYDGIKLDIGFRADLIVNAEVIVEIKAMKQLEPVHDAQVLSYLRFAEIERGLLINFHAYPLRDGIKRFSLTRNA